MKLIYPDCDSNNCRNNFSQCVGSEDESGNKIWNDDYKESGHYYDPIYDNYVIHFLPEPPINDDW